MSDRPASDGGAADRELTARVALCRLAEPGDPEMGRLVEQHGPQAVLDQVVGGTLQSTRLSGYQARLPGLDVRADLVVTASIGARVVVPGSDEWPEALDDLGHAAPLALWLRGPAELAARAVAVVGARACTAYGEHVAASIAAGLGDRGWTVVSGAAFGIDAAAHRGAMAVDGPTIAVLACGIDLAYPSAHDGLLERIRGSGLVVSELPPGCRPSKPRFLTRNRVIAALSRGTVVVEAALRSGAANTAGHAVGLS